MQILSFQGQTRNFYHLLKKKNITTEGQVRKGEAMITGYTQSPITVGDIQNISNSVFTVCSITDRRNHAGIFDNPEDSKNGFFNVECTFEELISVKQ